MQFPLSETSKGVFFACQDLPEGTNYQLPFLFHLPANVNVPAFQKAVDLAIDAHPLFNCHLAVSGEGEPVWETSSLCQEERCPVIKCTEAEFAVYRQQMNQTMDILGDRLWRFAIYVVNAASLTEVYFFLEIHHVMFDGFSMSALCEDISAAYAGKTILKEEKSVSEISLEEKNLRDPENAAWKEAKQWYATEYVDAAEVNSLPLPNMLDDANDKFKPSNYECFLDLKSSEVQQIMQLTGAKANTIFCAAFGYLLASYGADNRASFNTVYHGRADRATRRTICMMSRVLPLYVQMQDSNMPVNQWLQNVNSQIQKIRDYQYYNYQDAIHDLGLNNQVLFAYQGKIGTIEKSIFVEGQFAQCDDLRLPTPGYDFVVEAYEVEDSYMLSFYDDGLHYTHSFFREFAESFAAVIRSMLTAQTIGDLQLCSTNQLHWLDKQNENKPYDINLSKGLVARFKEQVALHPDAECVVADGQRFTYRQIDEMSDTLPADVIKCGSEVLGYTVPRNVEMVVVPLAIAKVGKVLLPLDSSYPQERLLFMQQDASQISPADNSERPFTLLYTSGTTGTPKGVMMSEKNILYCITDYINRLGLGHGSRFGCYASYGFDAYVADMWAPLCSGACLHIIGDDVRFDLESLHQYIESEGITHLFMTTQVGTQLVTNYPESRSLRFIFVGGEKLVSLDPPQYPLWNGYGPTEGVCYCCCCQVTKREADIPIGKPTPNYQLFIVNKHMQRVPVGAAGELLMAGPQVTLGYLGQPERTAESFINWKGLRVYRTGDVVRYREDGNIVFVGRKDGQVKVRGFRIELKEVEAVIRDFPGISNVTVQAFDEPAGGKAICAYIVSNEQIDINELNRFIADQKPPYMVPAVTMQIDTIPLNVNQKVDVRKLPKPEIQRAESAPQQMAPLNKLELEILEIVRKTSGVDEVPITEPLIFYGLTSISALKLATQLHKTFGISPDMHTFLKTATIQSIENLILEKLLSPAGIQTQPETNESSRIEQSDVSSFNPERLTYQQSGVYYDCLRHPDDLQYNIPVLWTMPEGISADEVLSAVKQILTAHHFDTSKVEKFTLSQTEFEQFKKTFVKAFDLTQSNLYRIAVVSVDAAVYVFTDFHHLIFDGASYDIFMQQLTAVLNGEKPELEAYTYSQYAADQREAEGREEFAKAKEFFDKQMEGFESAQQLEPDVPSDPNVISREANVRIPVSVSIDDFCRKNGISKASFYLSAAYLTCHAFSGNQDVYLCTVSNGRSDLQTSNTFGMFVNTLALKGQISDTSVADFLKQNDANFRTTLKHEYYPFSRVATDYNMQPQVIVVYEVGVINNYKVRGQIVGQESLELKTPKFPLCIMIDGEDGEEYINLLYDDSLFSQAIMQSFATTMEYVVEQMLSKKRLFDIAWVNPDQLTLLDSFNNYQPCPDTTNTIVSLFRQQADATPNNVAVIFDDVRYTYKQLDQYTDYIASRIREIVTFKKDEENVVSILINRSEWMVIATLAALKSGCAYQPLDPSYPPERLNYMAEDARASVVLANKELTPILTDYKGPWLFIEDLPSAAEAPAVAPPSDKLTSHSLFALLYTSGTTGTPKGVMLEHRNLVSFCHWAHRYYEMNTSTVAGAFSSFGFDPNMMDMFPTLTCGGAVCIVPEATRRDIHLLHDYFEDHKVTMSGMTTQVAVMLAKAYPHMNCLRRLNAGGEKMPSLTLPDYALYNCYGPTECTIQCTAYHMQSNEANVPIGGPMDNAHIYVVDPQMRRLPVGAVGELLIAGDGVSRGYLRKPEKTAEVFVPFSAKGTSFTVYRSGDVVRYRADGNIEFVGRKDGQVKIRGFRVELKEVETVIQQYHDINNVTVQAFDAPTGGKMIAAYVVSDKPVDIAVLTQYIRDRKPPYMVPACIMQIDAIPLNVNQKVDKKRLPAPVCTSAIEYVAPEGPVESALCRIFAEALGLEQFGATDHFFEMGGSSLVVTQVIMAAQKQGINIAYADVFEHPTARELAQMVKTETKADDDSDLRDFDYSRINSLLQNNNLEAFLNADTRPLGNVLLLGATGFLGIHIFRELIENYPNTDIYCILRGKRGIPPEERLRQLLFYYFENNYATEFGKRVHVIEGDVSQPFTNASLNLPEGCISTVINCAAVVKHFAKGSEIEDFNVGSVKNCVDYCLSSNTRLIQVSTTSVAGMSINGVPEPTLYSEQQLWIGQYAHNQYIHSKLMGERIILDAVANKALDAKIMRVGNLSARSTDGEYQANFVANTFMGRLRVYKMLGVFPYSSFEVPTEFSPINELAQAVCLLSQTPKACCVFHPFNHHTQLLGDVVERLGNVQYVEQPQFAEALEKAGQDPEKAQKLSALLAYQSKGDMTHMVPIMPANSYTMQVLLRMGFHWSKVSSDYVDRFIRQLSDLGFFDV